MTDSKLASPVNVTGILSAKVEQPNVGSPLRSVLKLSKPTFLGIKLAVESEFPGLREAETIQRMGKTEK